MKYKVLIQIVTLMAAVLCGDCCNSCQLQSCSSITQHTVCSCLTGTYQDDCLSGDRILISVFQFGLKIYVPSNVWNSSSEFVIHVKRVADDDDRSGQSVVKSVTSDWTRVNGLTAQSTYLTCFGSQSNSTSRDQCIEVTTNKNYGYRYEYAAIVIGSLLLVAVVLLVGVDFIYKYINFSEIYFYNVADTGSGESEATTESSLFKVLKYKLGLTEANQKVMFVRVRRVGSVTDTRTHRPIRASLTSRSEALLIIEAAKTACVNGQCKVQRNKITFTDLVTV